MKYRNVLEYRQSTRITQIYFLNSFDQNNNDMQNCSRSVFCSQKASEKMKNHQISVSEWPTSNVCASIDAERDVNIVNDDDVP